MLSQRYCDGMKRRDFVRVGVAGGMALNLATYLKLSEAGQVAPAKGKSAIFIALDGGPSHLDMFDMKPNAPAEFRGEFKPIKTNVPGIEICEHLPKLATCADKYAILRGVSHNIAAHEMAGPYMVTGNRPTAALEYPGYGCVATKELRGDSALPTWVDIAKGPSAHPNTTQHPGYLGVQYAPLTTNALPVQGQPFAVRGVSLAGGLTIAEVEKRQHLLTDLDSTFRHADSALVDGLDGFSQKAHDIITGPKAREAFDISKEPPAIANQFADKADKRAFGQSLLLAYRLVRAGVRFVTVTCGGWDTHADNFKILKTSGKLSAIDGGLTALFNVLASEGMLASTSVFVTGEFGRTPRVNPRAGRDHYPRAMFCLMAGGGMKGGQAIGASDEKGAAPARDPISPDMVAASFYHSLGIDYAKEFHTATGRPVMIVREGKLIPELFG